MALTLYLHPLASFCQKVLVALYENATPFTPVVIDLADTGQRARLEALWPMGRFPVLRDDAHDVTLPESTSIIEYLDRHYPGAVPLLPADPDRAGEARLWDRLFDGHVEVPMQKIVTDRIRPQGQHDPFGVAQARAQLEQFYGVIEQRLDGRSWIMGDDFGLVDCGAAPALFYAGQVLPFAQTHPRLADYFQRLCQRPAYARVREEAQPYLHLFPKG